MLHSNCVSQLPPSSAPRPGIPRAAQRSDRRTPALLRPWEPRYRLGRIFLSPLPSTRACHTSGGNPSRSRTLAPPPALFLPLRLSPAT